jgi:sarcosine oxidase
MGGPHIVVIGLGATGSAALCQLACRGVCTTGIEQFAIGHDRGSSHGPTRIIRLAHFENTAYVPLLRRAYALWRELEAASKTKIMDLTGIAEIGPPGGGLITGTLAAARTYDLPHEVLDANASMRRFPLWKLPSDFVAVLQPDAGSIAAESAIAANIRIATAADATLLSGEKVLAIEPKNNGVRVITAQRSLDADGAIIAAGPWMRSLLPGLHLPLRVTRQVVGWFEPSDPELFAADRFPVFILESRFGSHYGFPLYDSMGVKVGKHHHLDETVEPESCKRDVTAVDEAAIRAPLAEYLPAANGRLVNAHTCLYTMTPDGTFIVDLVPGCPQIVIASPCSGHGFKFAPVIGEITADLVTKGETAHDISLFRLERFGATA